MKKVKQFILIISTCLSLAISSQACATDHNTHVNKKSKGQESAGQYVDNSALTMKVKAKMMADKTVRSLPITVITYKGTVQLAGFVDDKRQIKAATQVVKSVDGVKMVKNCLQLKH